MKTEETWWRLTRSALLWGSADLKNPTRLHESICKIEETKTCSCKTPIGQLPAGTLVVVLSVEGECSLVSVAGYLPVWVESCILEESAIPLDEPMSTSSVPPDYLKWIEQGGPVPRARSRLSPRGGGLVLVRAEKNLREPWRWIGRVFDKNGGPALLLVDPTIPLPDVMEASEDQVKVVPLNGKDPRHLLLPL